MLNGLSRLKSAGLPHRQPARNRAFRTATKSVPVVALKLSDRPYPLYQINLSLSLPLLPPRIFAASHAFSICCSWWACPCSRLVKSVLTRRVRTVFFVCMRECIETSIVVSTLLAFLKQTLPTHRDASVRKTLVSQVRTRLQKAATPTNLRSADVILSDLVGSRAWCVGCGNRRRRHDWCLLWSRKGYLLED